MPQHRLTPSSKKCGRVGDVARDAIFQFQIKLHYRLHRVRGPKIIVAAKSSATMKPTGGLRGRIAHRGYTRRRRRFRRATDRKMPGTNCALVHPPLSGLIAPGEQMSVFLEGTYDTSIQALSAEQLTNEHRLDGNAFGVAVCAAGICVAARHD